MKNPKAVVREYVGEVKADLGVTDPRQFWRFKDHSELMTPKLGKMKGLWRVHFMMRMVLENCIRTNRI